MATYLICLHVEAFQVGVHLTIFRPVAAALKSRIGGTSLDTSPVEHCAQHNGLM